MAELIWDGKYDEHGNKRAPVRIELPFQTVETVNESAQERQRTLKLSSSGNDPEWRNRLIWGDKKYVLPTLLPEFAGKADLIYIDPPFGTGADFSFMAGIPESEGFFEKEPSILEQKAYRDTWGSGTTSYVRWFSEAVIFLRQLLSDEGSIYMFIWTSTSGTMPRSSWMNNSVRTPSGTRLFGDEPRHTPMSLSDTAMFTMFSCITQNPISSLGTSSTFPMMKNT